ncbi:hypothetical protein [Moraxella catarrhalis]|nr:hypothetical protein [Moraxella catarrhalis]OAV09664.1 hypothetical protein AO378_1343 [Moraxella catarrhalis]
MINCKKWGNVFEEDTPLGQYAIYDTKILAISQYANKNFLSRLTDGLDA